MQSARNTLTSSSPVGSPFARLAQPAPLRTAQHGCLQHPRPFVARQASRLLAITAVSTDAMAPLGPQSSSGLRKDCPLHANLHRHGLTGMSTFSSPEHLAMSEAEVLSRVEPKLVALRALGLAPLHMRSMLVEAQQCALWTPTEHFLANLQLLGEILQQQAEPHVAQWPPMAAPGALTAVGQVLAEGSHEHAAAAAFLGADPRQVLQLLRWAERSLGLTPRDLAGCGQLLQVLAVPAESAAASYVALLQVLEVAIVEGGGGMDAAGQPGAEGPSQPQPMAAQELAQSLFLARPGLFGQKASAQASLHAYKYAVLPSRLQLVGEQLGVGLLGAVQLALREPRLLDGPAQSTLPALTGYLRELELQCRCGQGALLSAACECPTLALAHPALLAPRLESLQRQLRVDAAGAVRLAAREPRLLAEPLEGSVLAPRLRFMDECLGRRGAGRAAVRHAPALALLPPKTLAARLGLLVQGVLRENGAVEGPAPPKGPADLLEGMSPGLKMAFLLAAERDTGLEGLCKAEAQSTVAPLPEGHAWLKLAAKAFGRAFGLQADAQP